MWGVVEGEAGANRADIMEEMMEGMMAGMVEETVGAGVTNMITYHRPVLECLRKSRN